MKQPTPYGLRGLFVPALALMVLGGSLLAASSVPGAEAIGNAASMLIRGPQWQVLGLHTIVVVLYVWVLAALCAVLGVLLLKGWRWSWPLSVAERASALARALLGAEA